MWHFCEKFHDRTLRAWKWAGDEEKIVFLHHDWYPAIDNISRRADSGVHFSDGSLEAEDAEVLPETRARVARSALQLGRVFRLLVRNAALYRQ